ncbi:MAG: SdrD B-like domain-containing protein [Patescibacteria group bacterium]|nr:SdrD B-like domain-containing protein [Patescibacteria group bacterium]
MVNKKLVKPAWNFFSWFMIVMTVVPFSAISISPRAAQASTGVVLFQDDFESGLASWTSDSGTVGTDDSSSYRRSCPGDFSSCGVDAQNDYLYFQNDAEIIKTINTTGYTDATFSYWRRGVGLSSNDRFETAWRIGTSGSWTPLESDKDSTWTKKTFVLSGSADQTAIQIRLRLTNAESSDKALFDDIQTVADDLTQPGIQITTINNGQPDDFSCPNNPPSNPITLSGSGAGSTPPGLIEQYKVQVDWGDGNVENDLGVFTPSSGHGNFTFTFTASAHSYTSSGTYTVKARLYHQAAPGNDGDADAVTTFETCATVISCGDGIKNGSEECDGTDGIGTHQSCSQDCTLVSEPYCGDSIVNGTEQCDAGPNGSDTCSTDCTTIDQQPVAVCGNGAIEDGEQCDDSNTTNGDGCSNVCQLEVLQCEEITSQENGWFGQYYNYFATDFGMNVQSIYWPDSNHGDPLSVNQAFDADWYQSNHFRFSRVDSSIDFGDNFFPFDIAPESATPDDIENGHDFHFGVHWSGIVHVDNPGEYIYTVRSDDDSWIYVDGVLINNDLQGIHAPTATSGSMLLTGDNVVDIYFAERHRSESAFSFNFDSEGVSIKPYSKDCPECGNYVTDGQEECDAGPNGSATCSVECTISICGNGRVEYGEQCDDNNTVNGDGCSNVCQLEVLQCEDIPGDNNGWFGQYYNYFATLFGMNVQDIYWPDSNHGDPLSVNQAFDADWYTAPYFRFSRIDSSINFGDNFFPFDIAPESADSDDIENGHDFHFGVHWQATAHVNTPGEYSYTMRSDDDSWVYLNGALVNDDLNGIHAPSATSGTMYLDGSDNIDIFFAERHRSQSAFSFNFDGEDVTLTPVNNQCVENPVCGNGAVEQGEQCDDGNTTSGDGCSDLCQLESITTNICGFKWNDSDGNQSFDEGESKLANWTIDLLKFGICQADDEWADDIISYTPGTRKNGTPVTVERSDASNALGVAENNYTLNFVSLGFGGELVLHFNNLIVNGAGDDLQLVESSYKLVGSVYSSPDCSSYPEQAQVFASQDGSNWVELGTKCLDSTFDLASLPWASYVKIVDASNKNSTYFPADADGFDVDGIKALNCSSGYETISTQVTDEDGNYCFSDINPGDYRVQEEMQNGWVNSTPFYQDVTAGRGDSLEVNFGNKTSQPVQPGSICGYKFEDNNQNGLFDGSEFGIPGWRIFATSTDLFTDTITNDDGYYCFNGLSNGIFDVFEEIVSGWATTTAATSTINLIDVGVNNINFGNFRCVDNDDDGYYIGGGNCGPIDCNDDNSNINPGAAEVCDELDNNCNAQIDEGGVCEEPTTECTSGAVQSCGSSEVGECQLGTKTCDETGHWGSCVGSVEPTSEICDEKDNNCNGQTDEDNICQGPSVTTTGTGGGGGGGISTLYIHNEALQDGTTNSITITWFTNIPADSRIVYDTVSHPILGFAPNYDYQWSTNTYDDSSLVTFHTVIITGLNSGTTYYFRPLSADSSNHANGIELSYFTSNGNDENQPEGNPPTNTNSNTNANTNTNQGIVLGVSTENNSAGNGTVAGEEYVEPTSSSTPTTTPEVIETGKTEETPQNCSLYILILLLLNIITAAFAGYRSRDNKNNVIKNLWWLVGILAVLPVIIWYPACWLTWWLVITLIASIVAVAIGNDGQQNQNS